MIMAISPIEFRYGTPEMKAVWTEEAKLKKLLMVEAALAKAEAEVGLISKKDAETIDACMCRIKLERVKQIEDEISHDMMAVVMACAEQAGDAGKWVHYGATSNDILDTGLALQLKDAMEIIDDKLEKLKQALLEKARRHEDACDLRPHAWATGGTDHVWASVRHLGDGESQGTRND